MGCIKQKKSALEDEQNVQSDHESIIQAFALHLYIL